MFQNVKLNNFHKRKADHMGMETVRIVTGYELENLDASEKIPVKLINAKFIQPPTLIKSDKKLGVIVVIKSQDDKEFEVAVFGKDNLQRFLDIPLNKFVEQQIAKQDPKSSDFQKQYVNIDSQFTLFMAKSDSPYGASYYLNNWKLEPSNLVDDKNAEETKIVNEKQSKKVCKLAEDKEAEEPNIVDEKQTKKAPDSSNTKPKKK